MFIIRALFWLAIVLLMIPAVAEGGHSESARTGSVEAVPDSRALSGSQTAPPPVPGSTG